MVSLEQIRALEARVEKAVGLIEKLRKENANLEQSLIEASRSQESISAAYTELEHRAGTSIRIAQESGVVIESLNAKIADFQAKIDDAELRALSAEEKIESFEKKALDAEAEVAQHRNKALAAEQKAHELETRSEELRLEQSRIEEGLTHALQKLDAFEDMVMGISSGSIDLEIEPGNTGDEKVEVVEESPSTSEPQAFTFPGADDELDIF
jgi:chromosome segregation ATPase